MKGRYAVRTLGELVEGKPIFALHQNLTVRQAAQHMASKKIGAVPVVEGGRLVGVFSERDLVTRVVAPALDPGKVTIGQVMTRNLVIAELHETYEVALERMLQGHIRHLPVVEGGRLVGFVSFRDLVVQDVALKGTAMTMMVSAVHLDGTPAMPALWKCYRCGHLEQADAPPERCPNCTGPREDFVLKED
jgi:CBS domain-containing protein